MKTSVITIAYLFTSIILVLGKTTPPNWLWANSGENTGECQALSITMDKFENVYVAGYFIGTLKLGNNELTSAGNKDIFIAKYDSHGTIQWANRAGGSEDDECWGIVTDDENVYIAGHFSTSASFGITTITSLGDKDLFLAKYNNNGTPQWIKSAGSQYGDQAMDIAVSPSGSIYITGRYSDYGGSPAVHGSIDFDTYTLTSLGNSDIFLAKYDQSGQVVWAKSAGGTAINIGFNIDIDKTGEIFISGSYNGTMYLDALSVVSPDGLDAFIAKYDSTGNVKLAISSECDDIAWGFSVAVDENGDFYCAGTYNGKISFGNNISLPEVDQDEAYLVKYSSNGTALWARHGGWLSFDLGRDVSIDGNNNVYFTGSYNQMAVFGSDTLKAQTDGNVYITKYDKNGNIVWARGAFASEGMSIKAAQNGVIVVAGYFNTPEAIFNTYTVSNGVPGTDNMFVAKLPAFATGIDDAPTSPTIAIYPNPVKDKLFISNAAGATYEVYDVSGRLLSSGRVAGNAIDVYTLPAGTYLLQLVSGDKRQALQFIKQ